MIDWSFLKQAADRIARAEERQADAIEKLVAAVEPIAAIVLEVTEEERTKRVPASEVTRIPPATAPPRVPRPRANV